MLIPQFKEANLMALCMGPLRELRHYYMASPWDHGYFLPRGSFDAAQGP